MEAEVEVEDEEEEEEGEGVVDAVRDHTHQDMMPLLDGASLFRPYPLPCTAPPSPPLPVSTKNFLPIPTSPLPVNNVDKNTSFLPAIDSPPLCSTMRELRSPAPTLDWEGAEPEWGEEPQPDLGMRGGEPEGDGDNECDQVGGKSPMPQDSPQEMSRSPTPTPLYHNVSEIAKSELAFILWLPIYFCVRVPLYSANQSPCSFFVVNRL